MAREENMLDDVLGTFSGLVSKESIQLCPMNSKNADINSVINDHIYGLLCLEDLTPAQLTLLTALLNARG
jgi:hypothetical protein